MVPNGGRGCCTVSLGQKRCGRRGRQERETHRRASRGGSLDGSKDAILRLLTMPVTIFLGGLEFFDRWGFCFPPGESTIWDLPTGNPRTGSHLRKGMGAHPNLAALQLCMGGFPCLHTTVSNRVRRNFEAVFRILGMNVGFLDCNKKEQPSPASNPLPNLSKG